MLLKVRYEDKITGLELTCKDVEQLLDIFSIDKKLNQIEKEKKVQEAFEININRPEYNNWHKFNRHRWHFFYNDTEEEDSVSLDEKIAYCLTDDQIFCKSFTQITQKESYDFVNQLIHSILPTKKDWAKAFIAVRINGYSINDYASLAGQSPNNITQKLKRATKKIKKIFKNRQISTPLVAIK